MHFFLILMPISLSIPKSALHNTQFNSLVTPLVLFITNLISPILSYKNSVPAS